MTLIRHELKQGWKALAIWTAAIGSFIVIALLIYPEMKSQMGNFSDMFASMGAFTSAFGMDNMDFGTLNGYYGIECGNILGIGGALFAAIAGISALCKEEKEGTAEWLLTLPMNRAKIVTDKLAAVLIQIVTLNAVVYLMAAGAIAAIGEAVPWKTVSLLHLAFLLLQIEIGCICFGISAFLWRGGTGIGLGLTIGLYFLNIISNLTGKADALKYITPYGYADAAEIINKGAIPGSRLLAGMALMVIGIALAYRKYCLKDIR